ncbi:MAG: hypothetical protein GXP29_05365 [Planctomycetes bacterium]|nr:hypothetical protein [Planctomycetota bacterium]
MKRFGKIYRIVAVLAVIHAMLLLGGVAMLAKSGKLGKENLLAIAKVLGFAGEEAADEDAVAGESDATPEQAASKMATKPSMVSGSIEEELARRSLQRAVADAENRRVLAKRAMLDVRRRREGLERLMAQRSVKDEKQTKQKEQRGFQKDLEILSSLKPKIALDSLLARSVEDAAQVMLAMETRQAKKIVEAARKDDAKWAKMIAIENKLRAATTLDPSETVQEAVEPSQALANTK